MNIHDADYWPMFDIETCRLRENTMHLFLRERLRQDRKHGPQHDLPMDVSWAYTLEEFGEALIAYNKLRECTAKLRDINYTVPDADARWNELEKEHDILKRELYGEIIDAGACCMKIIEGMLWKDEHPEE